MADQTGQSRNKQGYKRGMHPNSLKNLEKCRAHQKSWKPGQSGNPAGLSLKRHVSDILREPLRNVDAKQAKAIELLALAIVRDAIEGSKEDRREIWERLEGKVTQPVGGEAGGPVKIQISAALITDDELAEIVQQAKLENKTGVG